MKFETKFLLKNSCSIHVYNENKYHCNIKLHLIYEVAFIRPWYVAIIAS